MTIPLNGNILYISTNILIFLTFQIALITVKHVNTGQNMDGAKKANGCKITARVHVTFVKFKITSTEVLLQKK